MDFSKLLTWSPTNGFLQKLDYLGIRGQCKDWIEGFLTERQQQVVIDGQESTNSPVLSGVPQGTVLGPLLVLVYINDLPDWVKSEVRLFADDLILYREMKTPADCDVLQQDINSLCKCMGINLADEV